MYLLNHCSKCGRPTCRLNHIDEIYLNVKKIAKTPHLFRSYRTSKFSTLPVLIFLCTFHLIRLPWKSKSCSIVFKQVTHTRPDILSCLKQSVQSSLCTLRDDVIYEIVLHESTFVRIFRKKASQKLINHFTKVKHFCLWRTFGPHFARMYKGPPANLRQGTIWAPAKFVVRWPKSERLIEIKSLLTPVHSVS